MKAGLMDIDDIHMRDGSKLFQKRENARTGALDFDMVGFSHHKVVLDRNLEAEPDRRYSHDAQQAVPCLSVRVMQ